MRMIFSILALIFFTPQNSLATEFGQCEADIIKPKTYIQNDFQAPYPKQVVFSCFYNCHGPNGIESIIGVTKVRVSNINSDARTVVCQGVKVKEVSWGYDFDGTTPFYAYNTRIESIKKWAFQYISRENSMELEKLAELKEVLDQVGQSFVTAGSSNITYSYFMEAGEVLLDIARELPDSSKLLDKYLEEIIQQNGTFLGSVNTKEYLIFNNLIQQAHWRLPVFN